MVGGIYLIWEIPDEGRFVMTTEQRGELTRINAEANEIFAKMGQVAGASSYIDLQSGHKSGLATTTGRS